MEEGSRESGRRYDGILPEAPRNRSVFGDSGATSKPPARGADPHRCHAGGRVRGGPAGRGAGGHRIACRRARTSSRSRSGRSWSSIATIATPRRASGSGPTCAWTAERAGSKGGDLGPAIEPGDPESSLLIQAVRHEDEFLKMPPKGKLDDREIDVADPMGRHGCPGPHEVADAPDRIDPRPATEARAEPGFWAFRPPADPPSPRSTTRPGPGTTSTGSSWPSSRRRGSRRPPAAERRTLIRRATFDLTGLPPTPEEIDAFLADDAPDAFARVVDRLLASPALRRALGPALARRRPLRRLQRPRRERRLRQRLAVSRLRRRRVQRRQAVRPVRPRAARRRPAARRRRRGRRATSG